MSGIRRAGMAMAGLLALAGCAAGGGAPATGPTPAPGDVITIAVGPCFGFCPVYSVGIAPDGSVVFTGERHTEIIGERRRDASRAVYTSVAASLAPYRPADGVTQRVDCEAAVTDTSTYTITWRKPDGREAIATHQSRCPGGPGQQLDTLLQSLPDTLGIAAWARQVTRPGASRG